MPVAIQTISLHLFNYVFIFFLDELFEEELWEMERLEAMKRERLLHEFDEAEDW